MAKLFKSKKIPNLVIGLNQVDLLGPWNPKIGLPMPETEKQIERRINDIKKKLSFGADLLKTDQIEFYSALRAYRLYELLAKIAKYSKPEAIIPVNPKLLTDKDVNPDMPEDVRAWINAKLDEIKKKMESHSLDVLANEIAKHGNLTKDERKTFVEAWEKKKAEALKIGVIGKSGVGKTTTVNSLFQATFVTSRTVVGTTEAQYKDFVLPNGSNLTIIDMPGYGRSVAEDEEYQKIYLNELPKCDIILMVVQADSADFSDDQAMIKTIEEWCKLGII